MRFAEQISKTAEDTYRYLNFNQITRYQQKADKVAPI